MSNTSSEHVKEYIASLVARSKAAQKHFERNYKTQRAVDEVVRAAGKAVFDHGMALANTAVSETSMGNIEGKLAKLHSVALNEWNFMKGKQTVGMMEVSDEPGVSVIYKPLGVIGCVMPSTNPIATVVGNAMMAFKCRNSVIIAPHPISAQVSIDTVNLIREALKAIDAPEDLIITIGKEEASIEATGELLRQCDFNIATGGAAMVKSVYSAGKPAFGVGQGNSQLIVDEDITDYSAMVALSIFSRTLDQGVPCTGEQTMHIPAGREADFIDVMKKNGAYVIEDKGTIDKLRTLIFPDGKALNRAMVGKLPYQIGEQLGLDIPKETTVILFKNQAKGAQDVLCREILCPVIRYTTYTTFEEAVDNAVINLENEGAGHSSAMWSNDQEHIAYAADLIPVGRFHINQPTLGFNNAAAPMITIGCGSWGNNSSADTLAYYHLMNKTRVTTPLPNLRKAQPSDWDNFDEFVKLT